jgi:hypothetical protein
MRHKPIKATAHATRQLSRACVLTFVILFGLAGCNSEHPTPSTILPSSGPPSPTVDAEADFHAATAAIVSYERHLASHDWRAAWDELGDEVHAHLSFEDYAKERAEYGVSTKGQFVIKYVHHDRSEIQRWLESTQIDADLDRAYLAWIDYPLLAGNNAGFELYLVAPVRNEWRIWGVR